MDGWRDRSHVFCNIRWTYVHILKQKRKKDPARRNPKFLLHFLSSYPPGAVSSCPLPSASQAALDRPFTTATTFPHPLLIRDLYTT